MTVIIPSNPPATPTGTGLDQLVDAVRSDPGLAGHISGIDIQAGAEAAAKMNHILVEAISMTGSGQSGMFTADDVRNINQYIRTNYLATWQVLHGDDESNEETGYHLVQNDGAYWKYRGDNLLDTVADGLYHLGFEIQGDNILNEDGNQNASVQQLAEWLTQFYTDHSTTGTGLDRITDKVMADNGLDDNISDADIAAGADAANRMNEILDEAIRETGANNNLDISTDDIRAINQYIRTNYIDEWTALHGDDETGEETGYHLVQNDGATTRMFGKNFVNTVADGIYHLGFEIQGNNILNEDGNANATLSDLSDWVEFFYTDQSTTGTGLDYLTDALKIDRGLAANTSAADINAGAKAGNALNGLLIEAIESTGVANDANISTGDIRIINNYIRTYHLDEWTTLHGDDEDNEETGYHLVQNDGSNINFRGDNLINTVADGLYHLGFEIQGDQVLNEDGNANATLADLATWLNYFYLDSEIIYGTNDSETTYGLNHSESFYAQDGDDKVCANAGDDQLYGENGNDTLYGQDGNDTIDGGAGDDYMSGGNGDDLITDSDGNTIACGGDGDDSITSGTGNDKLDGGSGNDSLSAGDGNDTLYGQDGNDAIAGGSGDDWISGGSGDDIISDTDGNGTLYGGDGNDSIVSGAGNDSVNGDNGNDTIDSGKGDDTLCGGHGSDLMIAGEGNDIIYGEKGNDTVFSGTGDDCICGDSGDDTVTDTGGNTTVYGGNGNDTISTAEANGELYGENGNDSITSGDGDDKIFGGNGHDSMIAGGGNDSLYGDCGNDTIDGGAGNDRICGDSGNDSMNGGSGNDRLYGGDAHDLMIGNDGSDLIKGDNGNDILSGDKGDDVLYGGNGLDLLIGGIDNDTINGDNDNDILVDGNGADSYYGGNGNDTLISFRDQSNDTLYGGSGADTFVFIPGEDGTSIANDIIRDFSAKQHDHIEIGGADTAIQTSYIDTDGNGKPDATLIQLSDSNGVSLGSITVTGNLLGASAITLTGITHYENAMIPEGVEY